MTDEGKIRVNEGEIGVNRFKMRVKMRVKMKAKFHPKKSKKGQSEGIIEMRVK